MSKKTVIMARKFADYPTDARKAALRWWNALPAGKKTYLKAHQRLTSTQAITAYYLGCILPFETTAGN